MYVPIPFANDLPIYAELVRVKKYPLHRHKNIQILHVLDGELDLELTYTVYRLSQNDIHFIHVDDMHGIRAVGKSCLVLVINIRTDDFAGEFPSLVEEIFTTRTKENIVTWQRQVKLRNDMFLIASELFRRAQGYQERVRSVAVDMIRTLYSDFRGFRVNRKEKIFEHVINNAEWQTDRVSRIVAHLYRNYPYRVTLEEIAASENINRYHLSHFFATHMGIGFRDFLNMVRVEMSEYELVATDAPIAHIAENVGFSGTRQYVAHFEEWFGMHPDDFRARCAKDTIRHRKPDVAKLSKGEIDIMLGSGETAEPNRAAIQLQCLSVPSGGGVPRDGGGAEPCGGRTGKGSGRAENEHSGAAMFYSESDEIRAFSSCIAALKRFTVGGLASAVRKAELFDRAGNKNGFLTVNGLKKPLYYLHVFLISLFDDVVCQETGCIVTALRDGVRGILFSPDKADMPFRIDFPGRKGEYRLRMQYLSDTRNSVCLYRQAGCDTALSSEEFEYIQRTASPHMVSQRIHEISGYVLECRADAHTIIFFELAKCTGSH
ncbi:MAG: AraC family transcriptional regulator [Clostridiales Family XIII bacterium]|jgi:AraC-like DNA-binding protein|nr:AraC family transcriptional regulator [Clostridiales Family XIII bacterium]